MRTVPVLILMILALTLVACGGNDNTNVDASGGEVVGVGTATPIPPPTATPWPTLPPTNVPVVNNPQGHIFAVTTSSIYIIKPGDTLGEIAIRYSVSLDALAKANRIYDLDSVEVGEVLYIP